MADATGQLKEAIKQIPKVLACHDISYTGTFKIQVVAQDPETVRQFALKKNSCACRM
jgi:hypothetical protein